MLAQRMAIRRTFFSSAKGNKHRLTKRVAVSPLLLFEVVSDVARYNEFVPFVTRSFIDARNEQGLPTQGGFRVGWKDFDEEFVCRLSCVKDKSIVAESLTELLFTHLRNDWQFRPVKSRLEGTLHTVVDFTLLFLFRNPLYNSVSSMFQERVSQIMIDAFEKRARELEERQKQVEE